MRVVEFIVIKQGTLINTVTKKKGTFSAAHKLRTRGKERRWREMINEYNSQTKRALLLLLLLLLLVCYSNCVYPGSVGSGICGDEFIQIQMLLHITIHFLYLITDFCCAHFAHDPLCKLLRLFHSFFSLEKPKNKKFISIIQILYYMAYNRDKMFIQ